MRQTQIIPVILQLVILISGADGHRALAGTVPSIQGLGTLIPDTTFTWTATPEDGYVWTPLADPIDPPVTIPDTLWMVATFSTPESGWIIAEQAEIGTTEDRYGWGNPWNRNATFGTNYAGLWANLRCQVGENKTGGGSSADP